MTHQFRFGEYIQKNPKTLICKNICSPVFFAALFTIAKIWKQPECLLVDDWINYL